MSNFDIICRRCGGEAKLKESPWDNPNKKVVECTKCGQEEEI